MKLPGRFKVSPQIAGAIKPVSGVVDARRRRLGQRLGGQRSTQRALPTLRHLIAN
jgi:hypothetical protein